MDKAEQLDRIAEQLQAAGYKITAQRTATIAVILDQVQAHLSAEQIFIATKAVVPEIGLATVYRTLEMLTELHVLDKVQFIEDGMMHYDLCESNHQHFHHHLLCLQCGVVEEIHMDLLIAVEQQVRVGYAFSVLDHRLTFHGICARCQQLNQQNGLPDNQLDTSRQIDLTQL
ncbi:Fur family transcriptional regulator [Latilactobacillus graminis]|uniref:Ferric uptake regulation protein n=2 Tax=Latilactobacillus graminis TaxID=60519 RepID=A0AA89I2P2_9LACO|nr:Fur family transcriptional regulator [Latilactobacillus graminis]KRM23797.1 ferric uptake regulation protein [Latilactobacillus graminis DSM 20719]QFP79688.1 transcriptional repressor [Latilactobacillus graminis]